MQSPILTHGTDWFITSVDSLMPIKIDYRYGAGEAAEVAQSADHFYPGSEGGVEIVGMWMLDETWVLIGEDDIESIDDVIDCLRELHEL